ncbi:Putative odorant receptor 67a [Trachymyrmex zeteki]|uniref:Odorant receptor n=1 Tax=Mycetomoellerius zeteki TaxID=64791 RepID=A0A151WQM0_9HYME|nr:Putative odorant receptor 67a [Trachymyrmex zeteki]
MQKYCLTPKSDKETKIQNWHAQYGRKLGYVYTGFILGHSILYLFATLLTRVLYVKSKKTNETSNNVQIGLPFRISSTIDLDTYYVPIFIHCSISEFMYMTLLAVIDVLYLTVVEYCCGLFAALRYRLETALVFENERLTIMSTKGKSYANIVYSIRRHIETLQFVAIVESIYSLPLFIQIALTVLLLSLLGYQIVNNMENVSLSRGINHIVYLNGLLLNVLFENWQGQKIVDSSEKVFESAYNTKWYNMPVAARKLLIMIMMRSEKPSALKVGKIIVLSYVTFNAVSVMILMGDIDQFFQDSHYNIIRLLLSISGLWPFHTRNRRYAIYLDMVLILGSGLIFQILGIIEIWHDPFELLDTVLLLFFAVVIISKTFCTIHALPQVFLLAVSDVLYLIVIEHSCGLFVALRYNTEWYSMPIAARKLLIMIMMRSEKPLGLRMGKIVVLSYITFNTVSVIILWYAYV